MDELETDLAGILLWAATAAELGDREPTREQWRAVVRVYRAVGEALPMKVVARVGLRHHEGATG
jgi:hypothetical protein